jgi:hypothetical protein
MSAVAAVDSKDCGHRRITAEQGAYENGEWKLQKLWNGHETDRGLCFHDKPEVVRVRFGTLLAPTRLFSSEAGSRILVQMGNKGAAGSECHSMLSGID